MVHFVGAGPGAPDLITVRGQKLLAKADVVIYAGSLVNPELLLVCRSDREVYNSALMTLEEVLDVMAASDKGGKDIVRLHTGDPSLYGAVREQMDGLEELGIAYEVCPGVSAFSGAASSLNLEYTLPWVSQTVIISRMAGRTPVPDRESIRELARHQSTMVLFLSAGMLPDLVRELIAGGYAPDTPSAIIYKATWPDEKQIRCPLAQLPARAAAENIDHLALVIVGRVLDGEYARSKLYDPAFTTGFRKGEKCKQ